MSPALGHGCAHGQKCVDVRQDPLTHQSLSTTPLDHLPSLSRPFLPPQVWLDYSDWHLSCGRLEAASGALTKAQVGYTRHTGHENWKRVGGEVSG